MGACTLAIDCPEGLCRQRDQRHVARETSDKSPERPAVPKDMAVRWFAAYRKQIRGIMILPQRKCGHSSWLTKRNWRTKEIEILKETWNFEKEMNLAWIILHNWNWFRIDELYMLIFYKWLFTYMPDEICWEVIVAYWAV